MLLLLAYKRPKAIPREQYGIKYNRLIRLLIDVIACSPPKIRPEIRAYMYLLSIMSLMLFLNINSSVKGA